MSTDEFQEWRSERREEELEILQDHQQARIGADEDAKATREEVVGMSQDQRLLDEGWPTGADVLDHEARTRRTGPSR